MGHPSWEWPHVPGVDGAGEVEALGDGVHHIAPGARVAYHNDLVRPDSFAEYTVVPARALIPLPAELPFVAAATIPCPALTAFQAVSKVPLGPGAHVLVTGAPGAVGGALLQLARSRGWIVHAICSASQAERVLRLGAAAATDYRQPQWREELRERAHLQLLQDVFDMVSGAHAASLAPLLTANGHLVCIQDRQENVPLPAFYHHDLPARGGPQRNARLCGRSAMEQSRCCRHGYRQGYRDGAFRSSNRGNCCFRGFARSACASEGRPESGQQSHSHIGIVKCQYSGRRALSVFTIAKAVRRHQP